MVFVSGTDTGVGKTLVASIFAAGWKKQGYRVGVMKPCETGCTHEDKPQDALYLKEVLSLSESLDMICPYRFKDPLSPEEASRLESINIDPQRLLETFQKLYAKNERMVVEGAGGLLVPITQSLNMAGLASLLNLPLVIVARAGLGTVNHTLLTIEAARTRNLSIKTIVLVRSQKKEDSSEQYNAKAIEAHSKLKVIGPLPFLETYPPSLETLEQLSSKYF